MIITKVLQKRFKKKIKQRQNGIALLERRWMCPTRINKWPDPLKSRKVAPLAFFGVKKNRLFFLRASFEKIAFFFWGWEEVLLLVSVLEKMRGKERRRQSTKVCESRYSTQWWRKITFRMKSPQASTSSVTFFKSSLPKKCNIGQQEIPYTLHSKTIANGIYSMII